MSLNKVILIGRLGDAPDLKYTPTSQAVCTFSIATSETWVEKTGEKKTKTEWHRIVVWGKLAELCNQYLGKGAQVYIEGKNSTRSWDDKDGQKRYMTEVIAKTVQFLGSKNHSNSESNKESVNQGSGLDYSADNIPF